MRVTVERSSPVARSKNMIMAAQRACARLAADKSSNPIDATPSQYSAKTYLHARIGRHVN